MRLPRWLLLPVAVALMGGAFALTAPPADAHRDGCHSSHSCPSDSGSYVCGDTGNCSQCPDNQYCRGGRAIGASVPAPTPAPPASPAPAPAAGVTLTSPAHGARLSAMEAALTWSVPANATQEHLQVAPANNDGPGVNVIRTASGGFAILAPPAWYVLLPDMGYTWRVRTTDSLAFAPEDDPAWGPWSEARTFRTPAVAADGLQAVTPANGAPLPSDGPVNLQWTHPSPALFYWEIQASGDTRFDVDPATATSFVWSNLVHGGVTDPPHSWQTPPLEAAGTYYWRVRPRVQGDGAPVAWGPVFCFGAGCGGTVGASALPNAPAFGQQPGGELYPVVQVVDGDTVKVRRGGAVETLRLIGLDTPETVDPRKPVQCFGPEASARAHALLDGQQVRLALDPTQDTRDRYDRLLVYLWQADGVLFNHRMIADGYAHEYTYERAYLYQAQFRAAEADAKAQGRGFWGPSTCNGVTS